MLWSDSNSTPVEAIAPHLTCHWAASSFSEVPYPELLHSALSIKTSHIHF